MVNYILEAIHAWIIRHLTPNCIKQRVYKRVMIILSIILGKPSVPIVNENATYVYTGVRELNRYIYSKGDCGRLAYLLSYIFEQYAPQIYRIHWPGEYGKYHYIFKIFDKYVDAAGMHDDPLEHMPDNSVLELCDYRYGIAHPNVKDELLGKFHMLKLIGDVLPLNSINISALAIKQLPEGKYASQGLMSFSKLHQRLDMFNKLKDTPSVTEWFKEIDYINSVKSITQEPFFTHYNFQGYSYAKRDV